MPALISIILAVCNGEKFLPEQISSILKQNYSNLELIICDDSSHDNSFKIAKEFSLHDSRIRLYSNRSVLGAARNFLNSLSLSKGGYICFSDQDDYWHPDKIDILLNLLEKNEKNMLAYSDLSICDEGLNCVYPSFWSYSKIRPRQGSLGSKAFLRNLIPGCSMMFRDRVKTAMLSAAANSNLLHDHLAYIYANALGRIVYSAAALVKYRQHTANVIGISDKEFNRMAFRNLTKREYFNLQKTLPDGYKKIEVFCDENKQKRFIFRVYCIGYYLFIRVDTIKDKILGICECLFPRVYDMFRNRLKKMGRTV